MDYDDDKARPLLAVITGEKASLIVDAGNSYSHAKEFKEYIEKENIRNTKFLAITHWHWDHVYGMKVMDLINIGSLETKNKLEKVNSILSGKKEAELEEKSTVKMLSPLFKEYGEIKNLDIAFERVLEIDLGNKTCILECLGGDHSSDSTLIYIKEDKTMFLGDMPYRGFEGEYRTHHFSQVKRLRDEILKYDCEKFFTAHKNMYTRNEIEILLNKMTEIGGIVGKNESFEKSKKDFISVYNREPDEEEKFFIKAYVDGNNFKK